MSTNRKLVLLALMAIVLSLALASCSSGSPGETNAEVRVIGSAESATTARSSARAETMRFSSGNVIVAEKDITDQLVPEDPSTVTAGSNNVEFTAIVPVIGETVTYSVTPKEHFVFDEWEILRSKVKRDNRSDWRRIIIEIKDAIAGDPETITIRPELIRYIRPTFDRGYYIASGAQDGNGTKEKPFGSLEDVFKNNNHFWFRDDEVELTLKIQSNDEPLELDFSSFTQNSPFKSDDGMEIELKIIGGYGSNWNVGNNRTKVSAFKLPSSIDSANIEEMEIEFRNIEFDNFNFSSLTGNSKDFGDDDNEIEFRNCSFTNLRGSMPVMNGMIIKSFAENSKPSKTIFANSVVPYVADNTYYHCIITGWSEGDTIEGKNNIVISGNVQAPEDNNGKNQYVNSLEAHEYKFESPELLRNLKTATPIKESELENAGVGDLDDILEEDIEGNERFELDDDYYDDYWFHQNGEIIVSYGPYEYLHRWFDA